MSTVKQHQKTNTIRKYRDAQFLICNSCFWCASYLAGDLNNVQNCPACRDYKMDIIPISQKEAYRVNMDGSNVSMEFWNQPWLVINSSEASLSLLSTDIGMESPESRVVPTEDMNDIQLRISGEKFPDVVLELCDNCNWSLQCINHKGIVKTCPNCQSKVSLIPMNIDEVCSLHHDDRRGLTMIFGRRKPMR